MGIDRANTAGKRKSNAPEPQKRRRIGPRAGAAAVMNHQHRPRRAQEKIKRRRKVEDSSDEERLIRGEKNPHPLTQHAISTPSGSVQRWHELRYGSYLSL